MTAETTLDIDAPACNDELDTIDDSRIQIIKRPEGEYILIDGRLYTGRGAPVGGSWDADYHVHENIAPLLEHGRSVPDDTLWPLQSGVFDAETTVDLWWAMKR